MNTNARLISLLDDMVLNKRWYDFVHQELVRVSSDKSSSFGHTRVRFVSRSLHNVDPRFARHVFLEFQRGQPPSKRRLSKDTDTTRIYISEHCPKWDSTREDEHLRYQFEWEEELSVQLPNIPYGMREIVSYDQHLPDHYVLGFRDCRHHVVDMLRFCYPIDDKIVADSTHQNY